MAQVAQQAVADIGRGVGDTAQGLAQGDPGAGLLQALAGSCQVGRRQCIAAPEAMQRQGRVAQRAADPDVVARLRSATQQRLAGRDFAKHGDTDVERALGGIATHQGAAMGVRQGKQALRKVMQPLGIGLWQAQRQGEAHRRSAAGGQIAQVHGQCLVAQGARIHIGKKVAPADQHVAADGPLHAGGGLQQGAVVANAQHHLGGQRPVGARKILRDQLKLTQGIHSLAGHKKLIGAARKRCQMADRMRERSTPEML